MVKIGLTAILLLAAAPLGQAQLFGTREQPKHYTYTGAPIVGVASFYAKHFEGGRTASGETFLHARFTGASNFFKIGTWVEVKNLRNGKTVLVRINDKMAPSMSRKGRVVDLTIAAAETIKMVQQGLAKVSVKPVRPSDVPVEREDNTGSAGNLQP